MKKGFYLFFVILIFAVFISGCSTRIKANRTDSEGFIIGESNKEDNNKLQIKVIIEKINIRAKSDVNSAKKGIVEKGAIFDVVDYTVNGKYIWFKIKTDNNINGYVASELESPYVEVNQDIDYLPPDVVVKNNTISVDTRANVELAIRNNIEYSDNKDPNPKFEYTVDYSTKYGVLYGVEVAITDLSNNVSKVNFKVQITTEKQLRDGTWISYQDMLTKQEQAKSLCWEYGLEPEENTVGCLIRSVDYWLKISVNMTRIGFVSGTFCNYTNDLTIDYCENHNGNMISYDLTSSEFRNYESIWLPKFKSYIDEVKNITGINFHELYW